LIEVGDTDVILSAGKHVNVRMLQLALQACLALLGNGQSNFISHGYSILTLPTNVKTNVN